MQFEFYSQGKLVERVEVLETSLILEDRRKHKAVSHEDTLRAFGMAEHLVSEYKQLINERNMVIGRLAERALKRGEKPQRRQKRRQPR